MKLLLTSNGISNQSLADALIDLVGKESQEIKIGFVPTAVNVDDGNKDWFVRQLTDLQKFGFGQIDIVEIAAEGVDWRKKLNQVDAVYAGGGNPYYLLDIMRKTGFDKWLKENIDKKVYVGGSSGAIVLTPQVRLAEIKTYDSVNVPGLKDLTGLGLVDFEIAPHIPDWPSYKEVEEYAQTTKNKLYAIDNQTGIKVIDNKIEVISEGEWRLYNSSVEYDN